MEYTLIIQNTFFQLEEAVNHFIRDGWKPQGGVSVNGNGLYMQAMIKTLSGQ